MVKRSKEIGVQNNTTNTPQSPRPQPIHHQSRKDIFFTMPHITTSGTPTTHTPDCNTDQDVDTIELPSGEILLGATPFASWDRDGLLLTPTDEELVGLEDAWHDNKGVVTGAISSPTMSEVWNTQTNTDSHDPDATDDIDGKTPAHPTPLDILTWCEGVAESDSTPEPLPLIHGSFKRGVMGGQSANDILMIKGLIDVLVYVQFHDLSVFSCSSL